MSRADLTLAQAEAVTTVSRLAERATRMDGGEKRILARDALQHAMRSLSRREAALIDMVVIRAVRIEAVAERAGVPLADLEQVFIAAAGSLVAHFEQVTNSSRRRAQVRRTGNCPG